MTINEQINIICIRLRITKSELARRLGQSPQNFNNKLRRQGFSVPELEKIAEALDCKFERKFILPNGEEV